METTAVCATNLVALFKMINDPRGSRGRRFPCHSILSISFLAILSGAKSLRGIADWASTLRSVDLMELGIRRCKAPSESAIRRFLAKVDPIEVDSMFGRWLQQQAQAPDAIAIDGKTLRGTKTIDRKQCHLLSAVLHEPSLTIAQTKVDDKSNEITAVQPLLRSLDIAGCVVTMDAMHTQIETARYISEEKNADYVMTVKDNQALLKEAIETAGIRFFHLH